MKNYFSHLRTNLFVALLVTFSLLICAESVANAKRSDPIKIVFLGESSSKDPVWLYRVERMIQTAKKLPNVEFRFRFAEGDYGRHVKMIEEEVDAGVDAIIGPWWDPVIYNEAIIKAVKKGVFVYGLLGMESKENLPTEIVEKLGWAQTDWAEFGRRLAKIALIQAPKEGKIFWPAEVSTSSYITDAVASFKKSYAEKGISISVDVIEIGFDTKLATKRVIDYLSAHPDVKVIVTSGAIAIDASNRAVKEMGKLPGDVSLIGQVISSKSVQGIIEGYMPAGINLELVESSDNAVIDPFHAVRDEIVPNRRSVDFIEITKKNVAEVVPLPFLKGDSVN